MSEKVNFKHGHSANYAGIQTKDPGTLYAVNEGYGRDAEGHPGDPSIGSIYLGDKLLGTTKASELKTTQPIKITEGSPIDAMGIFKDNIIPAGTTIEELFTKLISKVIFPTPTYVKNATVSVTSNAPTITAKLGSTNLASNTSNTSTYVEVGETVTFTVTGIADTVTKGTNKVSGLTDGYRTSLTGDKNTATSISKQWSATQDGSYTIDLEVTKLATPTQASTSNANATLAKFTDLGLKVTDTGEVSLKATCTGPSWSCAIEAIPAVYPISNAGTVDASHKTDEIAGKTQSFSDSDGESNTFKFTGVRPYYYGISSKSIDSMTETNIKALTKGISTALNSVQVKGATNVQYYVIAVPTGWTIGSAIDPNGFECKGDMNSTTKQITCLDGTTVEYNVYSIGPTSQDSNFYINFGKQ